MNMIAFFLLLCVCAGALSNVSSLLVPSLVKKALAMSLVGGLLGKGEVDCFKDCFKSCSELAPGSTAYCKESCNDYCDQPNRTDGLSGSVSSTGGETGIFGTSTVVKGQDNPPKGIELLPKESLKGLKKRL